VPPTRANCARIERAIAPPASTEVGVDAPPTDANMPMLERAKAPPAVAEEGPNETDWHEAQRTL
jgi:hypothetical protein